jgi:hypothetical protein
MRTKTPTELLEDLAYESESVNVKAKLAIAIAHIQSLEQQRAAYQSVAKERDEYRAVLIRIAKACYEALED